MIFDETLLDRDILNENTMNDPALQAELFSLFFEQGKVYIKQLEDSVSSDSTGDWKMTTHGIKGASRSLGFARLASIAAMAESERPSKERMEQLQQAMGDTYAVVEMADAA